MNKQELNMARVLRAYLGQNSISVRSLASDIGIQHMALGRIVQGQTGGSLANTRLILMWLLDTRDIDPTPTSLEPITDKVSDSAPREHKPVGREAHLTPTMRNLVNSQERQEGGTNQ